MRQAKDSMGRRQSGLIRIIGFCLIFALTAVQVAHWNGFESPDEMTQTGVVSVSLASGYFHEGETGTPNRSCTSGFTCHAQALLVSVEFTLPVMAAVAQIRSARAQMRPGQFVDVPVPPPLNLRA